MTPEHENYDAAKDPRTGRPPLPIDAEKDKPAHPDELPRDKDQPSEIDLPGHNEEPGAPDAPAPQRTIPSMRGASRADPITEADRADEDVAT